MGVIGLTIGILALPLVHFSIAVLLGTHIHALGIVATSSCIIALSYMAHRRQESAGV
jgi:membrane protein DedA with SNARE-associated domain